MSFAYSLFQVENDTNIHRKYWILSRNFALDFGRSDTIIIKPLSLNKHEITNVELLSIKTKQTLSTAWENAHQNGSYLLKGGFSLVTLYRKLIVKGDLVPILLIL